MKMGQRICPSCGNEFSGAMEFCPVCTLRKALAGGVESGESSTSEDMVDPTPERMGQRFEHYELVTGKDGKPIVREYYGEQFRGQRIDAWKESNRRLFNYYRRLAPELPDSFGDMEPLFLAVICGCNAGLFHEVLHEVYIPALVSFA